MQPFTGTVGRAVIGFAAVLVVGRNTPAGAASGIAPHSDNGLSSMLRRPRCRAGARHSF